MGDYSATTEYEPGQRRATTLCSEGSGAINCDYVRSVANGGF